MSLALRGKILPPFVNSEEDLNTEVDDTGCTYRDLWKAVAVKYFDKVISDPVDYDITDQMIVEYSRQFEELRDMIRKHVSNMRTWQQLAVKHGAIRDLKRMRPPPNASYFVSEWLVSPLHHGPVDDSCGCGCGCGCG